MHQLGEQLTAERTRSTELMNETKQQAADIAVLKGQTEFLAKALAEEKEKSTTTQAALKVISAWKLHIGFALAIHPNNWIPI